MASFLKGKSKGAKLLLPILFALLVAGLIGFGTNPPDGGRTTSLGKVGDTDIPISIYAQDFTRSVNTFGQQFQRLPNNQEIDLLGFETSAISAAIASASFQTEIQRLGLSVGDERVAEEIVAISGLQRLEGGFNREDYARLLANSGFTVTEFEEQTRAGLAQTVLETAVLGAISAPDTLAQSFLDFGLETRNVEYTTLRADQLADPAGLPNDTALEAFYSENQDSYLSEAARNLTYVILSPEDVAGTLTIPEEELRRVYDASGDRFNRPAARIVDRLAFSDEDTALKAKADIESGVTDFDQLVSERGLTLTDVDQGDVLEGQIGAEFDTEVFGSEGLGVFGPYPTALGPALFRVNAVINAEVTSFENARSDLLAEAQATAAARAIQEEYNAIDDLLAAGASLEEVAAETPMVLGTYSLTANSENGVAAYQEFREAGNRVSTSDFPALIDLPDGGLLAMRLDNVTEPSPIPLDQIKERVIVDWQEQENLVLLEEEAARVVNLASTGTAFSSMSLSTQQVTRLTRNSVDTALPPELVEQLFAAETGDVLSQNNGAEVIVARLRMIDAFDPEAAENAEVILRMREQIDQQIRGDILTQYVNAISDREGVSVNQLIIDQVNANILAGGRGGGSVNLGGGHGG
ncbi:MAG: peptidylprolyl isomerase [Pseudomonadota bacterium]